MFFKKNAKKKNNLIKEINGLHSSTQDKNAIITKAHAFLSQNNIEQAHSIFKKINSHAGLMKVSKAYYNKGQMLEAYVAAKQAGSEKDSSKIEKSIIKTLKVFIKSNDKNNKEEYIQPEKENRTAILTEFLKNKKK